jgi:flagellar biosynthesis/type III secretory pathway protein FliH
MNSLARAGRVIRAARSDEDVFVLGEGVRRTVPADATLASVAAVLEATDRRADAIIEVAEEQAAGIVAEARETAAGVRAEAYEAGHAAGVALAQSEAAAALALIRSAASEGEAIRDQIANQAAGLVARAVSLALRRIVGEYYEADPARTVAACAEALRAAAGQDVVSIRVHPGLVQVVEASLSEAAGYVKPDDAVEAGGCIVDLRNGTIDATLDTRLSLMELALREAGGEVQL